MLGTITNAGEVFQNARQSVFCANIPAGEHSGFEQLSFAQSEAPVQGTVPEIPNTKSLSRWYTKKALKATNSHEVPQVQYYDPAPLLSLKVLFTSSGTVLTNPLLWFEQLVVMGVFTAVSMFFILHPHISSQTMPKIWKAFNQKDADIRNFCGLMSTMATFLLGFFTSVNVARWWRLRTEGIGCIWSASSQLNMYISQNVTRDEQLLSSIRRYARTSLMLVYMRQRGYAEQLDILKARGLLTEDEVSQVKEWKSNLSESIWTWVAHIVYMLYDQGLIKSDIQLVFLLERVNLGRAGAATIGAQLGTPIPMQYVHFIGMMAKLHNVGMAVLMGFVMAGNVFMGRDVMCVTIVLRVFFLPMLYNAILFINEEIMNPFSGDFMDFPMRKYDEGMDADGKSYVDAGAHLPSWMSTWAGKKSAPPEGRALWSIDEGYGSFSEPFSNPDPYASAQGTVDRGMCSSDSV